MKRFIEGEDRSQGTLFPEHLDDYIAADNPVRVIDVFVEELDLNELGFEGMQPEATGRPAYHPASLLKIYIYGHLNRIQSSRRLERETQRNIELIWLTGRLTPDFKTIADFRKDNGKAIRNVCREFILLCRDLRLFSEAIVAIDGSKFKAVNNRDKNFTDRKLKARMQQLEDSIARYMTELDRADREPAPDGQISLTDPDARSMATSGRSTGMVGYNVQTAVDTKHHLIVAHEVTNSGHDRDQLALGCRKRRYTPLHAPRGINLLPSKCSGGLTAVEPRSSRWTPSALRQCLRKLVSARQSRDQTDTERYPQISSMSRLYSHRVG
jgi:transposase